MADDYEAIYVLWNPDGTMKLYKFVIIFGFLMFDFGTNSSVSFSLQYQPHFPNPMPYVNASATATSIHIVDHERTVEFCRRQIVDVMAACDPSYRSTTKPVDIGNFQAIGWLLVKGINVGVHHQAKVVCGVQHANF